MVMCLVVSVVGREMKKMWVAVQAGLWSGAALVDWAVCWPDHRCDDAGGVLLLWSGDFSWDFSQATKVCTSMSGEGCSSCMLAHQSVGR